MKILALLEHTWEIPQFVRRIKERSGLDIICFSSDKTCQEALSKNGIKWVSEADYHFPEANEGVTDRSYYLSSNWWKFFINNSSDLTAGGINIPALIERDCTYFFLWVLRSVSFMQSLLRSIKPDEVWSGENPPQPVFYFRGGKEESLYGAIARGLASDYNITSVPFNLPENEKFRIQTGGFLRKSLYKFAGIRLRERLKRVSFSLYDVTKDAVRDLGSFAAARRISGSRPSERPAILVSSSESHVAPVLAQLRNKSEISLVFLRETFSPAQCAAFRKNGERFQTAVIPQTGPAAGSLKDFWNSAADSILNNEIFTWKNYSFGPLLREKFTYLFTEFFPGLIEFQSRLEKILQDEKINRILVEEDVCTFNKTLIQTANKMNIPSLVVQHGAAVLRVGFAPMSVTHFAAFGEATRQRLTEWGIEKERIALTGNVLHDTLHQNLPTREEFCRNLGLDPAKKIILLGMFPYRDYSVADFPEVESYPKNYFRLIDTAAKAVSQFPDFQLVVKLHPRDAFLSQCTEYVKKFEKNKIVVALKGPAAAYAKNCDCLVTVLSTLLIDTLPFAKPMVVVDFSGQAAQKIQSMLSMDIPVVPDKEEALAEVLREVFEKKKHLLPSGLADFHLGTRDGRAAQRAAELLLNCTPATKPVFEGAKS